MPLPQNRILSQRVSYELLWRSTVYNDKNCPPTTGVSAGETCVACASLGVPGEVYTYHWQKHNKVTELAIGLEVRDAGN